MFIVWWWQLSLFPSSSPADPRHIPPNLDDMSAVMESLNLPAGTLQSYAQSLLRRNHTSHSSSDSDTRSLPYGRTDRGPPKPKHFYKFWLWPSSSFVKIRFDRLALLAALDRWVAILNIFKIINIYQEMSRCTEYCLCTRYIFPFFTIYHFGHRVGKYDL